jgi:hypothetical protein
MSINLEPTIIAHRKNCAICESGAKEPLKKQPEGNDQKLLLY